MNRFLKIALLPALLFAAIPGRGVILANGGSSIPTVSSWAGLAAVEPAAPGTQRIILGGVAGAANTGDALALRGTSGWYIPSGDATALAYILANPIPAPAINPLRTHAYYSPGAAMVDAGSNGAVTSYALAFQIQSFPATINWTQVRLWGMDIGSGAYAAPTNIWFALADGGNQDQPTIGGGSVTWVAATGVTAPPSGTDLVPGIGPICNYVSLAKTTSSQWVAVRAQYASGNYNRFNLSTTAALIPDGFLDPHVAGDITGSPGTTSGWGESFGQTPAVVLEYNNLSTPVYCLADIGDSHDQGYTGTGSISNGTKGFFGAAITSWTAGTFPKVAILHLGRAGHTMAQISGRLHDFEAAFDVGGWIHQFASINDRTGVGPFDFPTGTVDASYTQLVADRTYLNGRAKLMMAWVGPGQSNLAAGAWTRFRTHIPDYTTSYPNEIIDVVGGGLVTDNADGSYVGPYAGADGAHPTTPGYSVAGPGTATAITTNLTNKGYSP